MTNIAKKKIFFFVKIDMKIYIFVQEIILIINIFQGIGRRNDFALQTYEFRNLLSSTNGIDDILKAIKHGTIGFYEG